MSGWTTDTLHTHFIRQIDLLRTEIRDTAERDRRAIDLAFNAQTTAMQAALAAADKAVAAALDSIRESTRVQTDTLRDRADAQNEWRGSLNDLSGRMMPRTEAEAIIQRLSDRLQELTATVALMVNRNELTAQHDRDSERITELTTRVTTVEALARGAQGNRTGIYAALGVATSLIVAIIVILNFVTAR